MPIKIKKKKDKKQKQKQKQVVNQRVVVNLADTKPRRRVARRRPQVNIPQSDSSLRQIVTQYIPIQSGASVPSIVKYYNNIMTPKTEPIKDLTKGSGALTEGLKAVRQQQQEDYTDAIRQSAQEEDMREKKQAGAGIIIPLVAEQDDRDVMNRSIIQQAEDFNKKGARRGRPAGSKNKSKEVKEQERLKKQAKRDARERRREELLRKSGYITENPQTDY